MSRFDIIGKNVQFFFTHYPPIHGIVRHEPAATGDCWHIERPASDWESEKSYLIQSFAYMEILS